MLREVISLLAQINLKIWQFENLKMVAVCESYFTFSRQCQAP